MAKPHDVKPVPKRRRAATAEPAFDTWLKRGLHQLFDDVAAEPVPEELLRLIREDEAG